MKTSYPKSILAIPSILSVFLLTAGCAGSNQNESPSPDSSKKSATPGSTVAMVNVLGQWVQGPIELKGNDVYYQGRKIPKSSAILLNPDSEKLGLVAQAKNGTIDGDFLWPNGIIPYEIPSNLDSRARAALEKAIATMNEQTVIKFVPKKASDSLYVSAEVTTDAPSSASAGWGRQTDNSWNSVLFHTSGLDDARLYELTLHELAHTVGMGHEFDRSDVSQFLDFDKSNFNRSEAEFRDFFPCFAGSCPAIFQQGRFDVDSVTNYFPYIFSISKDRSKPLITRKSGAERRTDSSGNFQLSERDIRAIAYLYQQYGAPLISKIDTSNPNSLDELPDLDVQPNSLVSIDFKTKNMADCSTHIKASVLGLPNLKVLINKRNNLNPIECNLSFNAPDRAGYYKVAMNAANAIESKDVNVCVDKWQSNRRSGYWVKSCTTQKEHVLKGMITQEQFLLTVGNPQNVPALSGSETIAFANNLSPGQTIFSPAVLDGDPGDRAEIVVIGGPDKGRFIGMNGQIFNTEALTSSQYEITIQARDIKNNKSSERKYTLINQTTGFCSQEKSDGIRASAEQERQRILNSKPEVGKEMEQIRNNISNDVLAEVDSKRKELEDLRLQKDVLTNTKFAPHPCSTDQNARYWLELANKYRRTPNTYYSCESAKGFSDAGVREMIASIEKSFANQIAIYYESIKYTQNMMKNNPNPSYLTPARLQSWIDSYTAAIKRLEGEQVNALRDANERLAALPEYFAQKFPSWDQEYQSQRAAIQAKLDAVKLTLPEIDAKIKALQPVYDQARKSWHAESNKRLGEHPRYKELGQIMSDLSSEAARAAEALKNSEMAKAPCVRLRDAIIRPHRITL